MIREESRERKKATEAKVQQQIPQSPIFRAFLLFPGVHIKYQHLQGQPGWRCLDGAGTGHTDEAIEIFLSERSKKQEYMV